MSWFCNFSYNFSKCQIDPAVPHSRHRNPIITSTNAGCECVEYYKRAIYFPSNASFPSFSPNIIVQHSVISSTILFIYSDQVHFTFSHNNGSFQAESSSLKPPWLFCTSPHTNNRLHESYQWGKQCVLSRLFRWSRPSRPAVPPIKAVAAADNCCWQPCLQQPSSREQEENKVR